MDPGDREVGGWGAPGVESRDSERGGCSCRSGSSPRAGNGAGRLTGR